MVWDKLFEKQAALDKYILKNHQLEAKDLFEEKFLALLVELGELANETRCFKYWSTKAQSKDEIILEEYVDNIHFLLSLGLEKGYQFHMMLPTSTNKSMTEQFNYVFETSIRFYQEQTEKRYREMFQAYLQLAELLGFTEEDILTAYEKKNEVNYERQEQGY